MSDTTYIKRVVFYGADDETLEDVLLNMVVIRGDTVRVTWAPVPPQTHHVVVPLHD